MTSSGLTTFDPSLSDLVVEAYSRVQVRPPSFTADHMLQARMSAQLLLSEWNVKSEPPNLWKISLIQIPLIQGVATYAVPKNVIAMLDVYIRQFQMSGPVNLTNAFSTTLNSTAVKITQANHGQIPGNQVAVVIPVSIGGLIILGFYQVVSVIDANNYTITASSAATGTVNNGGAVPTFTSTLGSSTVQVTLVNHGFAAQQPFTVQALTSVGGLSLQGVYTIASVLTANIFTITATGNAGSNQTVSENAGQGQVEVQAANTSPNDRVIFPISRSEYSAQPNKFTQDFPTTFWWDRLRNSVVNLWQVPDGNGPYIFSAYVMTQIEDAVLAGGVTMDLPNRFLEAFAAGLAAKLARKFAPQLVGDLRLEAQQAWDDASRQDTENVPLFIIPGMSGYQR